MASPGFRPGIGPPIETRDILADRRYQPTLRECLALGAGKARRGVCYAHYDMRNFDRSKLGTTGYLAGDGKR